VLIDSNTASACEPLIDLLQKKNIATLVGSNSAGEMLSGQTFKVDDNYQVFLPISDYQTADGDRLDKKGVAPDHEVDPEQALDYVLEQLIGQNIK
jgi:carboxyl-terminal processing protease